MSVTPQPGALITFMKNIQNALEYNLDLNAGSPERSTSWPSSVPPEKYRDNTTVRTRPIPSKYFQN